MYLCTTLSDCQFEDQILLLSLICVTATGRPELVVIVVMIATTKNPTEKTLSKVTMSMTTTMTTVLHRVLRIGWSSFPCSTVQVACIQGVLRSLRCCCLLLDWVLRPCVGLCCNAPSSRVATYFLFFTCYSVQNLPCRTACILVRACAFDIARPRGSAPRSFRTCASSQDLSNLLLF